MMNLINDIRRKFRRDQFEFSRHAVDRILLRNISLDEIRHVIRNGKVIEDYPDDKYGPSCLILGMTRLNRPLHIQCSYPSRPLIKIVTAYEPDPEEWIDFRVRRT